VIQNTLKQRNGVYGDFADNAIVAQALRRVIQDAVNDREGLLEPLRDDVREALDLIMTKISRILGGDPEYAYNWHDIQGYAKLIEDRILRDIENKSRLDDGVTGRFPPNPHDGCRSTEVVSADRPDDT